MAVCLGASIVILLVMHLKWWSSCLIAVASHCTAKQIESVRSHFGFSFVFSGCARVQFSDNLYQTCALNEKLYSCNTHTHEIISKFYTLNCHHVRWRTEKKKQQRQNELRMPSLLLLHNKINYSNHKFHTIICFHLFLLSGTFRVISFDS